jgi:SAM-dependent methyltransferase
LGLKIRVYEGDLFSPDNRVPPNAFDLVYSLGFIEHFQDLKQVLTRQLDYVKPGGWLLIGVPHFIQVFSPILRLLAPAAWSDHNLRALDLNNWLPFEKANQLKRIYRGYLGGLDWSSLQAVLNEEKNEIGGMKGILRSVLQVSLKTGAHMRGGLLRIFPLWRDRLRLNSSLWSAYAIAIYQKPAGK